LGFFPKIANNLISILYINEKSTLRLSTDGEHFYADPDCSVEYHTGQNDAKARPSNLIHRRLRRVNVNEGASDESRSNK
jgi:hypothetical protein